MSKLGRSIVVFCAMTVLLAGCKPSQSATAPVAEGGSFGAQPGGKPGAATYVSASPLPNQFTTATITDQFKANAEEYHRRYAASDHFQALFSQALAATTLKVAERPLILDLGSGSGVNSIVPCRRLFPGARMVATDLSGELLAMLGAYALDNAAADEVVCVKMDAMSETMAPGAFDLVTSSISYHFYLAPRRGR